jgi:hypothetical protein
MDERVKFLAGLPDGEKMAVRVGSGKSGATARAQQQ